MGRYGVKDVFLTLQGEGLRTGTKALFVRFTGCNLWDGLALHRDRGDGPCALWCDTDFFKGSVLSTEELMERMDLLWNPARRFGPRWCVLTGGEPTLQIDKELISALKSVGWNIAVETNGTIKNEWLSMVDHVCLSPKRGTDWRQLACRVHEVKVILPGCLPIPGGNGWTEEELEGIRSEITARNLPLASPSFYVQPQDPLFDGTPEFTHLRRGKFAALPEGGATSTIAHGGAHLVESVYEANVQMCSSWVLAHPEWRLSLQTNKMIHLP